MTTLPESNPHESNLPPTSNPPWGNARFKLFFNKSRVVRVNIIQSSGNAQRDKECIAWCKTRTVVVPKKGVRTSAQWYMLDIGANAALDPLNKVPIA
jgi:hypothetical protein